MGMGIRGIANAFELSRNTVRRYVRMFQDSGVEPDKLLRMSDEHLHGMFALGRVRETMPSARLVELQGLLPEYAARLSRKGVMVKDLYDDYHAKCPDGYLHSAFGKYLRQYMLQTKAVGHVEHRAGDQMYVDFAGDRLELVDERTGEIRKVEVFVAILPCSHYTYCEAVWSQRKEDLIKACENALLFFKGAPLAIVPDNLKAAVTHNDRLGAVINSEFAAFAEHYGCAVVPARPRHPKDKALVENAVKLMYRSVYRDIEGQTFNSLESLNEAILRSLAVFNDRKLTGRNQSRRQLFEYVERDCLRPLPAVRHQMKQRIQATVQRNSYITLNKHHYSVPTEYIGKRVDIVYDADSVEIYYGLGHVASHMRDDTPYEYTTKPSHNLPGRHGGYEADMDEIYARAASIDNIVLNYLRAVAEDKRYPALAFRACRAIIRLEDKYGQDRLVASCAAAMEGRLFNPSDLISILETGADADYLPQADPDTALSTTPAHKNIRGAGYYSSKKQHQKTNDNGNNR